MSTVTDTRTRMTGAPVIEGVDPEVNASGFVPAEYGQHIGTANGVNNEGNLEVDAGVPGIEVNKEHEGIEVQHHLRASWPGCAFSESLIDQQLSSSSKKRHGWSGSRWLTIGLVALVAIAALLAGLVAGLAKSHKAHPQPWLASLAAVNWTTKGNITNRIVITQASDSSLIAFVGQTNSWSTVNISQLFEDSGGLGVRPNTPLAAVANSNLDDSADLAQNQLCLFYTTDANEVVQLVTHDPSLSTWDWGDVGPHSDVATITTGSGSRLAAAWKLCDDGDDDQAASSNSTSTSTSECGGSSSGGTLTLAFEDAQQNFVVANSTYNWTAAVASDRLAGNSSLALVSMNYGGRSDYVWGFFDTNGILGSAWQDYQNGDWWWTNQGRNVMYDVQPSALNQFAATSFANRTHAFVAALVPNGTVAGRHWDPALNDWHPRAQVNLVVDNGTGPGPEAANANANSSFSTIAMTADARLYGAVAADGSVQEYEMDSADPYTFHWVGEVS
ncbi:hypothetical protein GGR56DRAFT_679506 [Xylariaceae sp. FL0804]|nr:hypothetical protein GGR56DRAFT_679506 [Xylariaceae sp. FL0804]